MQLGSPPLQQAISAASRAEAWAILARQALAPITRTQREALSGGTEEMEFKITLCPLFSVPARAL